jgi:hypothetical protein
MPESSSFLHEGRAMRCRTGRSVLPAVILIATGCSQSTVNQAPLASDRRVGRPSADASLVLGGTGPQDDWATSRNDATINNERQVYYGPEGHLYYDDGSRVPFKSLRRQLQDFRAEERIR